MKGFFKNIQTLLIVVLVVIILLLRSCGGGSGHTSQIQDPIILTDTVTLYDTIIESTINYVPQYKIQYQSKVDTVFGEVDTLAILKDYYAKYVYTDTLYIDTLGYAVINDTITRNSILSRNIKTNIVVPTSTVTNTIYINERELYWGLGLSGRTEQLNYLGGELLLKTKKHQVYSLGLGVNQDFKPVITVRMFWKIKR